MRLSEAMRIGASWSGQCTEFLKKSQDKTTCALGAAYEGTFGEIKQGYRIDLITQLYKKYPYLSKVVNHPINPASTSLDAIVIFLNDTHRWSRERIADWVEAQENQHPEWFQEEVEVEVKEVNVLQCNDNLSVKG